MKNLALFILPIFCFLTSIESKNIVNSSISSVNNPDYETFKNSITKQKAKLINHSNQEIANYFFKLINNDIYSYWAGTTWEFYGKTRTPKIGNIACGYFVTNTLTDVGLKIDRVKLAECRSGDMIKALCKNINSFNDFKKLQAFLNKQPNQSVFIIGLDFHTGYIVKDSNKSYFMHSYYKDKQGVVKEAIESSEALLNNKFFMIGSLTSNQQLMQKWTKF